MYKLFIVTCPKLYNMSFPIQVWLASSVRRDVGHMF